MENNCRVWRCTILPPFLLSFFNVQTSIHTLGSHLFSYVLLTFLFFIFTNLWRIPYISVGAYSINCELHTCNLRVYILPYPWFHFYFPPSIIKKSTWVIIPRIAPSYWFCSLAVRSFPNTSMLLSLSSSLHFISFLEVSSPSWEALPG